MTIKRYYSAAMLLAVLALTMIVATPLGAQSDRLRVEVPFDFYAAGEWMPAGTYTVSPQPGGHILQIKDRIGKAAFLTTLPVANRLMTNNRLVFNRYGSIYFLSEIHWAGLNSGRSL